VELAEREVRVYRFEELRRLNDRRAFSIECSSGTYVRSLIAALGDAYCETLRRVRIGGFDVRDADPDRLVPLAEVLNFIPAVSLGGDEARRAGHGVPVPGEAAGTVRLLSPDGELIALADPRDGALKPTVVFVPTV
jgi:tRNA pseudouridine55 synthase